ncbi:CoA ester lyase [Acidianus sp. RZ1]|uniref:HpcH/HpaI aldolase/citrate lyase family protein n=1 Tax=Acidianus sp. RZ1 TaxID=1540082 RepID=UPI0020A3C6CA|nr:CoA ester lyase [Acidianus sp. RZ1]
MQKMRRSQLYVPANNEKMIKKSLEIKADTIIFDLEDAVPPEEKGKAREMLKQFISELDWGKEKELAVRVNEISTKEGLRDLIQVAELGKINTILIPKAEGNLSFVHKATGKEIIPIVESAKGLFKIEDVLTSEGVSAITYGIADLSLSLEGKVDEYIKNDYVRTKIIVSAKAYNVEAIDRVYFDLKDPEGFRQECLKAKNLGYNGKQAIHPSQVEIANTVFSPTEEEVEWAKRVIEAYEKSIKEGRGAIRVDDKLVDYVHYKLAKRILSTPH